MIKKIAREFLATLDSLRTKRGSYSNLVIFNNSKLIKQIVDHADDSECFFFDIDADVLHRHFSPNDLLFDITTSGHRRITVERHQFVPVVSFLAQNAFDSFIVQKFHRDGALYDVYVHNGETGHTQRTFDELFDALDWIRSEQADPDFLDAIAYRNKYGTYVGKDKVVYQTIGFGQILPPHTTLLRMGRDYLDTRLTILAFQKLERTEIGA